MFDVGRERMRFIAVASYTTSVWRVIFDHPAHHLKDRHQNSWDRFSVYLTIGDSHLKELESLHPLYKPAGNKQKESSESQRISEEDLQRCRAYQRDELISLLGKKILEEEEGKGGFYEGKKPVLAKYITGPMKLRARYKGRILRARVRRDGSIRFRGKVYLSPS